MRRLQNQLKQLFFSFTLLVSALVFSQEKPNVIYINADDLGYGDVGAYGATRVYTPNIDKLAADGKKFTDAHSVSAVCTPSRYGLITGEYPVKANVNHAIFDRDSLIVPTSKFTLANVFKEQGYATACVGKWHLGFGETRPVNWNEALKPGPLELGFDYYFGVPVLNSHPPFVYVENHKVVGLEKNDPFVWGEEAATAPYPEKWNHGNQKIGGATKAHQIYVDSLVGTTLKDTAQAFIRKHKKEPFFLYLATTNIHHPFTPAKRFLGKSDAGRYGDFIQELDWIVGEILKTLEEENLTNSTMVVFTSDNGGMLNRGGQDAYTMDHHMNGELLGFKFDAWEGGHRVPFIVKWPGKVEAGSVSDQLISNIDMVATFAALFKRKLQQGEAVDSYNMLPAFLENPTKNIRPTLLIAPNSIENLAVRKGEWVYISGQGGGGFEAKHLGKHAFGGPAATTFTQQQNSDIAYGNIKENAPPAQLYNLKEDLSETENLYEDLPKKVEEMQTELERLLQVKQTRP